MHKQKLKNCAGFTPTPQRKAFGVSSAKAELGFTLIELLVVVAIIGLLASVVLVSVVKARYDARDTKRLADLATLQKALDLYYQDKGYFPPVPSGPLPWGFVADNLPKWQEFYNSIKPYLQGPVPISPDGSGAHYLYGVYEDTYTDTIYYPPPAYFCMHKGAYFLGVYLENPFNGKINTSKSWSMSSNNGTGAQWKINYIILGGKYENVPAFTSPCSD